MEFAKRTYVDVNIFHEEHNKDSVVSLDSLPASCWDSAEMLNKQRAIYERHSVFPPQIIDGIILHLKMFKDKFIRKELEANPDKMLELVHQYFYCG